MGAGLLILGLLGLLVMDRAHTELSTNLIEPITFNLGVVNVLKVILVVQGHGKSFLGW